MDDFQQELLKLLSQDEYKTSEELAKKTDKSERTIRTRIKELNDELDEKTVRIISKQHYGYLLQVYDKKAFENIMKADRSDNSIPSTSAERVRFLLAFLLKREDYIKLDDMAEFLFVSNKIITNDLKKVEYLLNQYHVEVERKPGYGIKIKGTEFDIRLCISHYLLKNNMLALALGGAGKQEKELQQLGEHVLAVINSVGWRFSEVSFTNLLTHIYVAVKRIAEGYYVQIPRDERLEVVSDEAIGLAECIASEVKQLFQVQFQPQEITYLAIHCMGKRLINGIDANEQNIVIPPNITDLAVRMVEMVYEMTRMDFRKNFELMMSLSQHLLPLDIRIHYNIPLKNPLKEEIKRKYPLGFSLASHACIILKMHYKKEICEDEVAYIALLFALALEHKETNSRKYNVLLVCSSRTASLKLLNFYIKDEFSKFINQIYECDLYQLETYDLKNIDYIITTVPININSTVPVFEVGMFLEQGEKERVRKSFERGKVRIQQYYKREFFFTDINAETKEEAISKICSKVSKNYKLPDNFYDFVLKREELAPTDFGNMVAMPHPYKTNTKDSIVSIAILDKPIMWNRYPVQVVLMVSISPGKDPNLQQFYQITMSFFSNEKEVTGLIKEKSYDWFIQQLTHDV